MSHVIFLVVERGRENYQTYNTAIYNIVFAFLFLCIQNQSVFQAENFRHFRHKRLGHHLDQFLHNKKQISKNKRENSENLLFRTFKLINSFYS